MKSIKNLVLAILSISILIYFSNINSPDDFFNSIFQSGEKNNAALNESGFEKAIVKKVVDGDTVKVEFSGRKVETIRLLLIDTPESVKPNTPVQPFGKEASDFLKKILIKDNVIDVERGNPERDKYGRLLAYVWLDNININQMLLEKGYARVAYVYPPNTKYLDEFKSAEEFARKQKVGIWSVDNYVHEDGFYKNRKE